MEKTSEGEKKKWLDELITKCLHLALHMTSNVFNVNQKINQKNTSKRMIM
jgi:hypothetical protein